jgi:glycerate kinase
LAWRTHWHVVDGKSQHLPDAGSRVEQQQEKGVVASSHSGAPVGLGKDLPDVLGVEILDGAAACTLRSNVEDALVLAGAGEIVSQQVLDEAVNGSKPTVARGS